VRVFAALAYNAHAPYCQLSPAWLCNIFPHYLINATIFGRKLWNVKCVLWFYLQRFIWDISHSKTKGAICDKECILVFGYSTRYSCPSLLKLQYSRQILGKYSDVKSW